MTEKVVVDYVVSFEDGQYLLMKVYEDRQWDTVESYTDPLNAITMMHRFLDAMKNECCQNPGWCAMPYDYCPPAYWR